MTGRRAEEGRLPKEPPRFGSAQVTLSASAAGIELCSGLIGLDENGALVEFPDQVVRGGMDFFQRRIAEKDDDRILVVYGAVIVGPASVGILDGEALEMPGFRMFFCASQYPGR